MILLKEPLQFQWDEGNKDKNLTKHRVTNDECEEVFFDDKKRIVKDKLHSEDEPRYILLGKTKKERQLFVVFTIRDDNIRIISARDLNRKETGLL